MRAASVMRPASEVRGIRPLPTPFGLSGCIISDLSVILPAFVSMVYTHVFPSCRCSDDSTRGHVPTLRRLRRLRHWCLEMAWTSHRYLRLPPDVVGKTFGQRP